MTERADCDAADLDIRPLGRPPEVPDAIILQAGQRLLAAGRAVTGYALRTTIGVGNPRRLVAVWERLRANTAPDAREEASPDHLPPGLVEIAQRAASEFDAHIRGVILRLVRHVEERERRRYREDFEQLAGREARAAQELRDAAEAMAEADALALRLQQQVAVEQERVSALSHRHAALEASLAALEQERASLRAEGATLQAELATLRRTAQQAEQAAAVAEAARAAAMSETLQLRIALEATTQRAHAAAEARLSASEEAATARAELVAARSEIDRLRAEREASVAHTEGLAARASAAEARLAEVLARTAPPPASKTRRSARQGVRPA